MDHEEEPPPDLSHAGAVVDQAIDYMVGKQIDSVLIASALLGGAMALMSRTMQANEIKAVLGRALANLDQEGQQHSNRTQ